MCTAAARERVRVADHGADVHVVLTSSRWPRGTDDGADRGRRRSRRAASTGSGRRRCGDRRRPAARGRGADRRATARDAVRHPPPRRPRHPATSALACQRCLRRPEPSSSSWPTAVERRERTRPTSSWLRSVSETAGVDVRPAFLELATPSIPDAIDACDRATARPAVLVQPHFLAPGNHTTRDIPDLVEAARDRHPGIRIDSGPHTGSDPALPGLVANGITAGPRVALTKRWRVGGPIANRPPSLPRAATKGNSAAERLSLRSQRASTVGRCIWGRRRSQRSSSWAGSGGLR